MSPLFGRKQQQEEEQAERSKDSALQAEVDRLESLPLTQLAAEVMTKGFGPAGPGADEDDAVTIGGPNVNAGPTVSAIALEFAPGGDTRGADEHLRLRLHRVMAEGLQVLEHACLVRAQMHTSMNSFDYALTRLGRAALERGAVERILGGGNL
jgi:hypothetical protein